MFGSHLSVAGGLYKALDEARRLDMDSVQIFTANQRQWNPKAPTDTDMQAWVEHRRDTGIEQVVSHDSYLINLASPDDTAWEKSIAHFRAEMLRCESLGIQNLVTHPGAHMGSGDEAGLARVAAALSRLHRELPRLKVVTCLEITAGQGSGLGCTFEHLQTIIDQTMESERLAVCLDTAHLLEAGYDLTSERGARQVLRHCDKVLGLERVRVLHLNDSRTPRGSRVDRHAHIGKGHVSLAAFAVFCRNRRFRKVPRILETPKEDHPDTGEPWDTINLRLLKSL